MVECDSCEDDVLHVWRHRAISETVTHRKQRWVCADCHPKLAGTLHSDTGTESGTDATTDASGEEKVIVTDGGQFACPSCGGETVNGQGVFGCPSCDWTGVK